MDLERAIEPMDTRAQVRLQEEGCECGLSRRKTEVKKPLCLRHLVHFLEKIS